jgi:hypothetical protein
LSVPRELAQVRHTHPVHETKLRWIDTAVASREKKGKMGNGRVVE